MTHKRFSSFACAITLVAATLTATAATTPPPAAAADGDVTLTFVIEAVRALDTIDDLDGADFYPQLDLAGTQHGGHSLEITDDDDIQPDWRWSPPPSSCRRR